jgi:hypothetical protein
MLACSTIALQLVTAVTSDTVNLTIDVEITSRAGPKPASPTIRNLNNSLKKKKTTTHQHVIQSKG